MSRTHRLQTVNPEVLRKVRVQRVEDINAGMRRVVFGGPQMGSFTVGDFTFPAFQSEGFDDFVRFFFPYPGQDEVVLPTQRAKTLDWPRQPKPLSRNYTVRHFDRERGEFSVDFCRHVAGVASTWGERCQVGDTLDVLSPARSGLIPHDIDAIVLFGDEAALPAIARCLEEVPAGLRAQVVVEIAGSDYELDFVSAADVDVTWVHRTSSGNNLEKAVVNAPWPDGVVFAWGAGESTQLRGIRRYLRETRGLPREMVEVTGYWRRAEITTLADDPKIPDVANQEADPAEKLFELAEIFSPFAIRVASTLRIPLHIASGVNDLQGLARATDSQPRALAKFLRYLTAIDVVVDEGEHFSVGPIGEEMLGEEWVSHWLDLDGIEARVELSVTGLRESLQTGRAGSSAITGRTFADDLARSPELSTRFHEHLVDDTAAVLPALLTEYSFGELGSIRIAGEGSGVVLNELLSADPGLSAIVVGLPSQTAGIERDVAGAGQPARNVVYAPGSVFGLVEADSDAYLLVGATDPHPDEDLEFLFRSAASAVRPGGKIVLLDRFYDTAASGENNAEYDLLFLCMFGSGLRTLDEITRIAEQAGLTLALHRDIGMGYSVVEFQHSYARIES